jgi:VIT1/CCC1 family predicted Fe2+/Mn2+ transporter
MEGVIRPQSLLDPMERVAEIMFGLIMALSFTCTMSIAISHDAGIKQLLIGAIGCNLAWGLVDATMYLIGVLAQKNRNKMIFDSIRSLADASKARVYIADALPPVIASVIEMEELDQIRDKLKNLPDMSGHVRLTAKELKKAMALCVLVVFSTFPVVLPFIFIQDSMIALRVSNLIAIVMLFLCGWSVAAYVGFNKWKMSSAMILIGLILVAITIALGG